MVDDTQPSATMPAHSTECAALACLSDEEILAFASGRLHSTRHSEAHLHFDECETCQRLLSEAAHALATAATAPLQGDEDVSWNTTFQPGTLVGRRYLIRHFIARGGMGEVYEAFDRDLNERVALKTVTSTACDNPNAVRRLKAEVQLARRVGHPNVCRIYDFGTHVMAESGAQISFLTMEFVDGETLGQRVRLAGALPVEEARELGRAMLLGLRAAHDAGVLHRDLKSDNVMLRAADGDECSPVILDFGLARALDEDSRNASASNPNLVGTFGYIAPEQLEGRPHSTASDVYSFGVVWFEMLTGELPFESSSSPALAALERLQRPAAPPSSKNPLVPSDLDAIVLGCLRRSPKDRFRTAGEVLSELSALESLASRTRVAFQKRKLVPLAVAAALGGFAAYMALTPPKPKPDTSAVVHALSAALVAPSASGSPVEAPPLPAVGALATTKREPLRANPLPRGAQPHSVTSSAPPPTARFAPAPALSAPAASPAPSASSSKGWEDPFGANRSSLPELAQGKPGKPVKP
ncbi:MAG TPA: serine/threonine-protein kinase [Polyangiaceae bacterium]|jgi:serine/threonine protein kinase